MNSKFLNFFNSLIFSDFSIINNRACKQFKKVILLNDKNFINSLNLFILNKNIKQFIKILAFFSRKRRKKLTLSIYLFNYFFKLVLKTVLEKKGRFIDIVLYEKLLNFKKNYKKESILFLIDYENINLQTFVKFFNSKTYFILILTLKYNRKNIGLYQLNNTVDTIKKSVFISVLIKRFKQVN